MSEPDTTQAEERSPSSSVSEEKKEIQPKGDWKLYAVNQIGSDEAEADPVNWNLLIYGDPGAGKTRFGATAVYHDDMRDVLFLNIEGGLLTVREMGLDNPPLAIDVRSAGKLEEIFWQLRRKEPPFDTVRTVVIDNASELVQMEMEAVVARKMQREGDKHTTLEDVFIDDHGEVGRRLGRILRWYRDLDVNTIITAHPRYVYKKGRDNQPTDILKECEPDFPAKLKRSLMGYQDFVWFMYITAQGTRGILTQKKGAYYAKTRGEVFPKNLGERFQVPLNAPVVADLFTMLRAGGPLPEQYTINAQAETPEKES